MGSSWNRRNSSKCSAAQRRYYKRHANKLRDERRNLWHRVAEIQKRLGARTIAGLGKHEGISIITTPELLNPTFRIGNRFEKLHEKGNNMTDRNEALDTRQHKERSALHEAHSEQFGAMLARHRREHRALEDRHAHERAGGSARSDADILDARGI